MDTVRGNEHASVEKTCRVLTEKPHTGIIVDNLVAQETRAWWNLGVALRLLFTRASPSFHGGQILMWTEEQFHFLFCAYFCPNVIGSWSRAEVHQQELSATVPLPTQSGSGSHLHLSKPALMSRILHLHFWAADGGGDASFMLIDVGGVPWTQKQEFGGMFWYCEDDVLNLK